MCQEEWQGLGISQESKQPHLLVWKLQKQGPAVDVSGIPDFLEHTL